MNLVPLFEEALEFQDYNGTVLSDGKVAVYYIGRTRLADIYEDVDGSVPAENPRILNNLGMGPVYVNPAFDYEMVVYDAYGSELFSVKKYLASKGEHSTANVVVTPSESIAVSAWTIGDVQVYMPYLTGQLGKVYEGIDPIVVNNTEDKISANHVPLGVQDPLYFVQDDEEGCIIGFSGETLPEGTMNESAFGYENNKITGYNGSAFSAGNEYEAGNYISIDNNTISVTGLTPVPADTASTGLVAAVSADITAMIPDTSDMATQTWVNEQGFLTAHQDISNKLDTTAFSTVSSDFLTAVPSEYVTENTLQSGLSSKLDSTAFSAVSGDFLTAHQSLDGLMSADLLEISDNKITGYNGTAFAGQGGVTGDYELVAGSGVELVDDPDAHTTTINVTAEGGNPEVEQAVIDNSATWDSVTAKQDALSFDYKDTAISSIDNSAIYDNSAHARINTLAGRISDLSSNKLDASVSGSLPYAHYNSATHAIIEDGITATPKYLALSGFLTAVPSQISATNLLGVNAGTLTTPQLTADSNGVNATGKGFISTNNTGIVSLTYTRGLSIIDNAQGKSASIDSFSGINLNASNVSASINYSGLNIKNNNQGREISISAANGGKVYIDDKGASGLDGYGNVNWQVGGASGPAKQLVNAGGDPQPGIIMAPAPTSVSAQWTAMTRVSGNNTGLWAYAGPTASAPYAQFMGQNISIEYAPANSHAGIGVGDVTAGIYTAKNDPDKITWSLTGSVQKREIEGDTATSAITAIAGSAIGGGIPAGTMNESAFEYDENDKISGYNGSAFAGGSDVPEGVMVESGLEYNAVNEISGYNGSAIAQYGAEKQWLVHDDTLVHASNSAQYALGVNLSAVAQLLGVDETVLWDNANGSQNITLNEAAQNFEFIKVEWCPYTEASNWTTPYDIVTNKLSNDNLHLVGWGISNDHSYQICTNLILSFSSTTVSVNTLGTITISPNAANTSNLNGWKIYKIIGIGRKQ